MLGNAAAIIPEGESWIEGVDINPIAHTYTPEDRAFIADARNSLPLALDALVKVLELHRENTPEDGSCQGYTDTGYGYLDSWCVECSEQSGREYGTDFPCLTVQAITETLIGGESVE